MVKWTDCLIACWRDSFEDDNVYILVLLWYICFVPVSCSLWHWIIWNEIIMTFDENIMWTIYGIYLDFDPKSFFGFSLVFLYWLFVLWCYHDLCPMCVFAWCFSVNASIQRWRILNCCLWRSEYIASLLLSQDIYFSLILFGWGTLS